MQTQQLGAFTFGLFRVVCPTEGCENKDIPIDVWVDVDGGLVMCGPCGKMIPPEGISETPS